MHALRCQTCGGPLPDGDGPRWVCRFCETVHERVVGVSVDARVQAVIAAADEARAMGSELQPRLAGLEVEVQRLTALALAGDRAAAQRSLQVQETVLRLTFAPTVHMLQAMDPTDPMVADSYRQLDDVVAKVLAAMQASYVEVWELE